MTERGVVPLPVDPFVPELVVRLRRHRAVVLTAAPGAGKTTRVPPALVANGPVLLLQPRRVAARAIARRIAVEQGWTLGHDVGWHVRFERHFTADTRLIVATEGVLTARLQHDPLLSDISTLVIDEFHERSIHADLGLAFAREAWRARSDLAIVVMSATLDPGPVAAFLDDCPVLDIPGTPHRVDISYHPGLDLGQAVVDELPRTSGAVLCFLPGAPEIRRADERLQSMLCGRVPVFRLHGSLDSDEQDRALDPSQDQRVILATNIAETTLTVPDVTTVIDTGWHKVARYDAARGIDSLELERISQDAADQRAGRAGRLSPGRALRLWDARDRLAPQREPEIERVDLTPVLLDVIAWGGAPRTFAWLQAPASHAVDRALALLMDLGALDHAERLTPLGDAMRRLPLHPRLSRVLLAAGGAPVAAQACAVLSERHFVPTAVQATTSDLLSVADDVGRLPGHVRRIAEELTRTVRSLLGREVSAWVSDEEFRRAILAGYPDRVARRRSSGSDRFLLSSGTGARLGRESGVFGAEFVVAIDVTRAASAANPDAVIRIASGVEREWVHTTRVTLDHALDADTGEVRATRTEWHGAIPLHEAPAEVDPERAAAIVARAYLDRGLTASDEKLAARLRAAGVEQSMADIEVLVLAAATIRPNLHALDLASALRVDVRQRLDNDAPANLLVPSGRRTPLDYRTDGRIVASVKLQELFGLAQTPRIGPRQIPVTFELLAPNGRPVQVTSDLKSFWMSGYPEVRKELRSRYPKHPWPDDPWTATPTHRTLRRAGRKTGRAPEKA